MSRKRSAWRLSVRDGGRLANWCRLRDPRFMGVALLAPDAVTIAGPVILILALQLQTRHVEEPYLLAVHGEQYAAYAAHVGRFLPGVGGLRP